MEAERFLGFYGLKMEFEWKAADVRCNKDLTCLSMVVETNLKFSCLHKNQVPSRLPTAILTSQAVVVVVIYWLEISIEVTVVSKVPST